ncbi:MAG: hypothetical protein ACRDOI_42060, partial [Trebonia sp.]
MHEARGFRDFQSDWRARVGDGFPLPAFSAATIAGFRARGRSGKVLDTAFTSMNSTSAIQTAGSPGGDGDHVRLWIVQRGAWALGDSRGSSEHTVEA